MQVFLKAHVSIDGARSYGLGMYRFECGRQPVYYAVGGDFGVDFFTAHIPDRNLTASALGNTEINTYPLLEGFLSSIHDV